MQKDDNSMIRRSQKVDVKGVVALFGGKHQIVSDYERILRMVITVKAVEKWIERNSISLNQFFNLTKIAEKRHIRFKIEEYIQ